MKREPLKTFCARDFVMGKKHILRENYLDTLIKLGLIEEVTGITFNGVRYSNRRDIKGYRIIK
jgi:hypothetical protein